MTVKELLWEIASRDDDIIANLNANIILSLLTKNGNKTFSINYIDKSDNGEIIIQGNEY